MESIGGVGQLPSPTTTTLASSPMGLVAMFVAPFLERDPLLQLGRCDRRLRNAVSCHWLFGDATCTRFRRSASRVAFRSAQQCRLVLPAAGQLRALRCDDAMEASNWRDAWIDRLLLRSCGGDAPTTGRWALVELSLNGSRLVTDAVLKRLGGIISARWEAQGRHPPFVSRSCCLEASLPDLFADEEEALSSFPAGCPPWSICRLTHLDLSHADWISSEGVLSLVRRAHEEALVPERGALWLPRLRYLNVSHSTGITDAALVPLLRGCCSNGCDGCTGSATAANVAGADRFPPPPLATTTMCHQFAHLRYLDVSWCADRISDAALLALAGHQEGDDLPCATIMVRDHRHVTLPFLTHLDVSWTSRITDRGVQAVLFESPGLQYLNISNTGAGLSGDATILRLAAVAGRHVRRVVAKNIALSNVAIFALQARCAESLEELAFGLSQSPQRTEVTVDCLARLVDHAPKLSKLHTPSHSLASVVTVVLARVDH